MEGEEPDPPRDAMVAYSPAARTLAILALLTLAALALPHAAAQTIQPQPLPTPGSWTLQVTITHPNLTLQEWRLECAGGLVVVEARPGTPVSVEALATGTPGGDAVKCAADILASHGLDWALPVVEEALQNPSPQLLSTTPTPTYTTLTILNEQALEAQATTSQASTTPTQAKQEATTTGQATQASTVQAQTMTTLRRTAIVLATALLAGATAALLAGKRL